MAATGLDKRVRKCVSVMAGRVDSVGAIMERRMRSMMPASLNSRHPLHETQRGSRSNRLLSLCCRTERFRRSFRLL